MKKSAKKAAPIPASVSAPEIPPLFRDRLKRTLEDGIETRAREAFAKNAAKDFAYAFEWQAEDALKEAYRSGAFERLQRFVNNPTLEAVVGKHSDGAPSDERIVDVLRHMVSDIERDLLGDSMFGSGGDGPWAPRSTSWAANDSKCVKANVDRGLRLAYLRLIEAYETRARFETCFAGGENADVALALDASGFRNWTVEAVGLYRAVARDLAANESDAAIDPDAQCPEHGCARATCSAEH